MSKSTKTKDIGRIATLLGCLCVFTLLPSAGWSADAKVYAASASCFTQYDYETPDIQRFAGWLHNVGPSTHRVTCPIIRDNTTNTTGTKYVKVKGYLAPNKGEYRCWLQGYSSHGSLHQTSFNYQRAAGYFTMELDLSSNYSYGFYSLQCNVPGNSKMFSYVVSEW